MSSPAIRLQPKQDDFRILMENTGPTWLGMGGGRGCAKSGGFQRIMINRRIDNPGTVGAILMRNYDQVKKYHIDVMLRDYPEFESFYHKTDRILSLPMPEDDSGRRIPDSQIHFTYAESLDDVIRRFRSGNYYDVLVDQAEQFTEAELREIKQAVRWKGTPRGTCKLGLAFNMGGVGISFLRSKFHLKEYNSRESADDYAFIHAYTWDNIEWVRLALEEDGITKAERAQIDALLQDSNLTEEQYLEAKYYLLFTDAQREEYCATRSDYGHTLVSQDEALVKRDWKASWESLEGAFFGRVFDRDAVVINREKAKTLRKAWWNCWMSQDWGKGHYCTTQWHTRGIVPIDEARKVLGWDVDHPVKLIITYREYIAGGAADSDSGGDRELSESDIAREIVERTPAEERKMISDFYLSPDAFEMSVRRVGQSQIAEIIGDIMEAGGLPRPSKADNARVDGWALMDNLFLATKRKGSGPDDECLLFTVDVPELTKAIPLLMRDPKNLDDVLKTDKQAAKLEQDCADTARYGYKSKVQPAAKPKEVARKEALSAKPDMTEKYLENLRFEERWKKSHAPIKPRARFATRRPV